MRIGLAKVRKGLLPLLLFVFALGHGSVSAQTRSSLTGTVRDGSGGVLPGVAITITSPNLVGGAQTTVTNAEGVYRVGDLVAGVYELTAVLEGFTTVRRPGLTVASSGTSTIDVTLEVAAIAEAVVVNGTAPTVDVESTATLDRLSRELLQNVPTSADRRLITNLIQLTPGTYARAAFGAAGDDNAILADGVSVVHPEKGQIIGSYGLSQYWLQEVEFVALGANAEFGEFGGNATNFRLMSGSNLFSGLSQYSSAIPGWTGDNRYNDVARRLFSTPEIDADWELSAQGGGPLIRDRLFFFAGYNLSHKLIPSPNAERTVDDERWQRAVAKVSWAASRDVKVEGFVLPDHVTNAGGTEQVPLSAFQTGATAEAYLRPTTTYNGRLTWTPSNRTLVEVRQGGLIFRAYKDPTAPNTRLGPSPHIDDLSGISSVTFQPYETNRSSSNTTGANVTRYLDRHLLKFGADFQRDTQYKETGFPEGKLFRDFGGAPSTVILWDGSTFEAAINRADLFAQDTWDLHNLTVETGVRLDIHRGIVPDKGTVFSTNALSPRLGLVWDVAGSHKTVVRAHYGWFNQRLYTGTFQFMDTARQTPQITARVLGPDNYQELTRVTPQTNVGIDDSIKPSYVEQFYAGVERELLPKLSFGAQYIHREFRNILGVVDTGSMYAPIQRQDPGPDGFLNTVDDGGQLTVFSLLNPGQSFYVMTNPADAWRHYNGLQLVATRRYSNNWEASMSYVLSRAFGTANNKQGDEAALGTETGQGGVFSDPNRAINSVGRPTTDFTHQLKVAGTYRMPVAGGIQVSPVYRYVSGAPWGRTVLIRGLPQGNATVRIEPRGTREGRGISQLDLRVEKIVSFRKYSGGIYADVFNLNNWGGPIVRFSSSAIESSGSSFGLPPTWIDPRTVQLGVRLTF
jgi:hypothetical protein